MRSARRRFVFLIVVMLILTVISSVILLPINVAAAGTLDQQQTLTCSFETLSALQLLGQTFTAGLNGPLTEVDLVIGCSSTDGGATCASNGAVTVEIHSDSPDDNKLGSSSLPGSAIPTYVSLPSVFVVFTFSPPPTVVAGSVYAIVITTTEWVHPYNVGDCDTNGYPDGTEWVNGVTGGTGWHIPYPNSDLAFKTYVAVAAPAVGGLVMPANTFALVAPWLAVIGLVACIGTVVVVARKRRP